MAIEVIVELQAKPGRRAELSGLLDGMVANQGSSQHGFLGSSRYELLDNPDRTPVSKRARPPRRTAPCSYVPASSPPA